jgi:hypothetical protein
VGGHRGRAVRSVETTQRITPSTVSAPRDPRPSLTTAGVRVEAIRAAEGEATLGADTITALSTALTFLTAR